MIGVVHLSSYDVVPANEATWADLAAVFGVRGPAARCWCQRYKLAAGEAFESCPPEDRADRLRDQTDAGHPGPAATNGLVAYADDEPVGWCGSSRERPIEGSSATPAWRPGSDAMRIARIRRSGQSRVCWSGRATDGAESAAHWRGTR